MECGKQTLGLGESGETGGVDYSKPGRRHGGFDQGGIHRNMLGSGAQRGERRVKPVVFIIFCQVTHKKFSSL